RHAEVAAMGTPLRCLIVNLPLTLESDLVGHPEHASQSGKCGGTATALGSAVLLDAGEEGEFGGGGEEAGFDGVGGEFAELVGGEGVLFVGEDVLVEEVGAEHGRVV